MFCIQASRESNILPLQFFFVLDPFVAVTLNLYKDANHAASKQHKQILPLWKYAGCITVDKLDKVENVLVIFTENSTIVFGFDGSSILRQWYEAFHSQFGKGMSNLTFIFLLIYFEFIP